MEWGDILIYLATVIGSVTTIGAALIWTYKKTVLDPAKRMDKELQAKSAQDLKDTIEPLSRSIEILNHNLEESVKDRKRLTDRADGQDVILSDHEIRIKILEDWRKSHENYRNFKQ